MYPLKLFLDLHFLLLSLLDIHNFFLIMGLLLLHLNKLQLHQMVLFLLDGCAFHF